MIDDSQSLFEQALTASRQKDFATARLLLKQLLKQEPNHLNAWLLAAHVVESRSDAIACCKRVLQIDPENVHAKQKLAQLQSEQPVAPPINTSPNIHPVSAPMEMPAPVNRLPPLRLDDEIQPPQAEMGQPIQSPNVPKVKDANASLQTGMMTLAGILFVVLCLVVIGIVAYIQSGQAFATPLPTPTNKILFDVFHQNARAATSENMKAYMNTVHPSSSMYHVSEMALGLVFSQFDLTYQYYNLKVISVNSNEAQVQFSLSTRKRSGPAFSNNIISGVVTLRPDNGVWKMYDQKVEETKLED